MLRHRLAGSLIVAGLLAGCASQSANPPFPTSHAVTMQELTSLRDANKGNPAYRVGLVAGVMPDNSTAALSQVNIKDFDPGDIITFQDGDQRTLAQGTVDSIDAVHNVVIVKYETIAGGRAPQQGDMGIRAIK